MPGNSQETRSRRESNSLVPRMTHSRSTSCATTAPDSTRVWQTGSSSHFRGSIQKMNFSEPGSALLPCKKSLPATMARSGPRARWERERPSISRSALPNSDARHSDGPGARRRFRYILGTTMATTPTTSAKRNRIDVSGIVQGVGFRPFVYKLAHSLGLTGYVFNSSSGVTIEIEGAEAEIAALDRK